MLTPLRIRLLNLLLGLFALSLFSPCYAGAAVMHQCISLMAATDQAASTNGSVVCVPDATTAYNATFFTMVADADNDSGTTPTLDITVQTCETTSTSSCSNSPAVFDQCTTGSCWSDGRQNIDLAMDTVNVFPCFRAVTTITGTNPVYDVAVKLCWK